MKLTSNAKVYTAEGKEVGKISRFVMDPRTKRLTHLVVERGLFSPTEVVIPLSALQQVDEDRATLSAEVKDLDELPTFVEDHYVITNEHIMSNSTFVSADPGLRMYYHYPPVNTNPVNAPGFNPTPPSQTYNAPAFGPNAVNPIPVSGADEMAVRKEVDTNIPMDTVAMKEGARVMSSEYQHVGDVEKVLFDPQSRKVSHFLISKGFLFKEHKLVPMDWVEKVYEDEVHLTVKEDFLKNLPDYRQE